MYHYLLLLSLSCICNLEARTINEIVQMRIVGGTPCTARMYPFIVAVRLEDPFAIGNYSHYCGGSLINSVWVLSAAHCYSEDTSTNMLEDYLVVAGISLQSQYNDPKVQRSAVAAIITKEYKSKEHDNDIALLKLKTPMIKTKTVDFVTLPANNLYPRDLLEIHSICTAMGWGVLIPLDPYGFNTIDEKIQLYPDQLMCVSLPLIRLRECKELFKKKVPEIEVANSQICTLSQKGEKDACGGDSGGPLVCDKIQEGITSWGLGCATEGYPGVFTRIDKYVDWIKYHCKDVKTLKRKVPEKPKFKENQNSTRNISQARNKPSSVLLSNYTLCLFFISLSVLCIV